MFKVKFHKKAKYQYLEIGKFIAQDNLFYANEVLNKIDNSIEVVKNFPYIGKEINEKYRQIVEPKYKFKVIYKINGTTIYVVGVYREQCNWE